MYDVIGDIHGHADELEQLLQLLGYAKDNGIYWHPKRQALFLGDFIDRGPKIREVLGIVRPMVDAGSARAVMGNHELNALAFHTAMPANSESYLRKRSTKNIRQHMQTIRQLNDSELRNALDWFRTLPMWHDENGLRAVHACWDENAMNVISDARQNHEKMTDEFLRSAFHKDGPLFAAVEIVLKGKEAKLPDGVSFNDKEGCVRTEMRTRWYLSPHGETYRTYALQTDTIDCDKELEKSVIDAAAPYAENSDPVFVGHYWLSAEQPEPLAPNVACVDYSVAKDGFLCAYRWNGEQRLNQQNFRWVASARR